MTDTRTLKEMMRELEIQMTRMETKQEYELNHLRNIDHHLEKLNTRTNKNELACLQNKNNMGWIIKIGSGLLIIISTTALWILKKIGIY